MAKKGWQFEHAVQCLHDIFFTLPLGCVEMIVDLCFDEYVSKHLICENGGPVHPSFMDGL